MFKHIVIDYPGFSTANTTRKDTSSEKYPNKQRIGFQTQGITVKDHMNSITHSSALGIQ